jgi:hypothetical protein
MGRLTDASIPFAPFGKEQTDAMTGMQKEILDAYEQANRAWLARVKSEVEFWSELTSKLAATRSVQEALEIYQKSTAQRHADGDRGRAAIDRGLSKDHAEVRRVDVQRMADEEHVRARSNLAGLAPEDCIRAMSGTAMDEHSVDGRCSMEPARDDNVIRMDNQPSWEWARLIRKAALDRTRGREARRLEIAVSTLPPEERGRPFSTD